MAHKILVGSNNVKKRKEIERIICALDFETITPQEIGLQGEPEETGETFAQNAAIKAFYYGKASGLLTLADDSGLVVDALGGLPGVRSARYAGLNATDQDNCRKLLDAMKDVPDEKRTAHFACAMTLVQEGRIIATALGKCHGIILREKRGFSGFGYDPVFFFPRENKTFAELPPDVKNEHSHRGDALRQIKIALEKI